MRVKPFKDFILNLTHNVKDEISAESTIYSGAYSKNIAGYRFSVGANSNELVFLRLSRRFTTH